MSAMAIHAIDYNLSKLELSHNYAKQIGDFCQEHGIKWNHQWIPVLCFSFEGQ